MLAIAFSVAASQGAAAVAFAAHSGDHPIYPDCRPAFVRAFDAMEELALDGVSHVQLLAPFMELTKAQIVKLGSDLHVPFERTWSCYKGGDLHCGLCGTCYERREAFTLAGVLDPTRYQPAPAVPAR
jgi:7-cyano-7-deazaguanine synthase